MWKIFSRTRCHKSYTQRERVYKSNSSFSQICFFLFVFVKCMKKSFWFFFLFNRFRLSSFFGGKNINLVNAKLVNTVLNMCTLKCVLCLYRCKYSEKYKRYLKMIMKIYWSCWTINVAIELDVGLKKKLNVVLLKIFFFNFFFYLGVQSSAPLRHGQVVWL